MSPIIVVGHHGCGKTSFLRYLSLNEEFVPDKNGDKGTKRNKGIRMKVNIGTDVQEFLVYDTPGLRNDSSSYKKEFIRIFDNLQEEEIKAIVVVMHYDTRDWHIQRNYLNFLNHTLSPECRDRIFFAVTNCTDVSDKKLYHKYFLERIPNLKYFLGWNAESIELFDFVDPSHIFTDNNDYKEQLWVQGEDFDKAKKSYRNEKHYYKGKEIVVKDTTKAYMVMHEKAFAWYDDIRVHQSVSLRIQNIRLDAFGRWWWWISSY